MDSWYSWVDAGQGDAAKRFSMRRTGRLLLVIMATSFLASLPLGGIRCASQLIEAERLKREWLQRPPADLEHLEPIRQAVRDGKGGESANRLFAEEYQEFLRRQAQQGKGDDQ